ncbi:MAG: WXG100 family type VII secretion target [Lachnospiraceae bacterium]|nr:WXG100 family type VII secretion target [Lachnospiraceae bacterium]
MSNTIQVSTTTLKNKANDLKNQNSRLKTQIDNLKTQEKHLNGMWDGEANDAFHKAFEQDITQMHNFYNAIEQYVAKLNEIAKAYEDAERKNIALANQRKYK